MNRYLITLLILLLAGCTSKYEKLYNQKPAFYAYVAGNVNSNNLSEAHNAKVYATPASCQKVITTLIALKALGPEYKYITEASVINKNGKIHDLIIKFSGDPTLTSDKLFNLLQSLKNIKISGDIILDSSFFKTSPYSHNLMLDDIGTAYATPVSAINIDKNLISVKISPKKPGELAVILADSGYKIKSDVITNNEKTAVKLTWVDGSIHVKGNINSADPLLELKISPVNHDEYIMNKLRFILSALNIKGRVKILKNKDLNYKLYEYINRIESAPIEEIIKPALKISDNLIFDSIYLTLIHAYSDAEIKDWEQGSDIMKNLINKYFAIDTDSALFVDGSGLSRYNRVQPEILLSLLKKGFDMPEFVDALAIPGEGNSTLKNRITLPNTIKAKTGNMSGISCLCGYSFRKNNTKAFVFMSSSFAPPSKELFEVMDNFVRKNS
ncbi:MAG: D-alanyl-D-alanine carboxypeptidase/D-alanyl-D-alanine-endopeptidase [Rickettsiaceae bacterium]|nr:D-alanyl-D-alanine carboxypeptidase/D-alanyl-D-alanine-endopeptidase [Rickettsiaceae bacterium]